MTTPSELSNFLAGREVALNFDYSELELHALALGHAGLVNRAVVSEKILNTVERCRSMSPIAEAFSGSTGNWADAGLNELARLSDAVLPCDYAVLEKEARALARGEPLGVADLPERVLQLAQTGRELEYICSAFAGSTGIWADDWLNHLSVRATLALTVGLPITTVYRTAQ